MVLTFACGAAYECGCVFWVHHSERGHRLPAVWWSCFNAAVTAIGVEAFLTGVAPAIAYVIGFGVGTFITMHIKSRMGDALTAKHQPMGTQPEPDPTPGEP